MDKQAYALVKALKEFRVYIPHSHSIVYVPSTTIIDILTQAEPDGRRAKWIPTLLDYDLEIRPTKLVKGQGLAKLMDQSNCEVLQVNLFDLHLENVARVVERQIHPDFIAYSWYKKITYVLQHFQDPPELRKTKARSVRLKAAKFCIINIYLYWKDPSSIFLNCLLEEEAKKKIKEFHSEDGDGHLYWKTTSHKIIIVGFYWPTLFVDTYKQVSTCHECQVFEGRIRLLPLPLNLISIKAPFQQWGPNFIGEINPTSSGQHKWILIGTDYFTKWIEVAQLGKL